MDTTLEDRLERLFEEASTLPPEQRTAFLDEACGADKELRCTLAALVSDAARANDFGDRVLGPAVARVAGVILGDSLADTDDGADPLLGQQIAHFQIVEKHRGTCVCPAGKTMVRNGQHRVVRDDIWEQYQGKARDRGSCPLRAPMHSRPRDDPRAERVVLARQDRAATRDAHGANETADGLA